MQAFYISFKENHNHMQMPKNLTLYKYILKFNATDIECNMFQNLTSFYTISCNNFLADADKFCSYLICNNIFLFQRLTIQLSTFFYQVL